jgi:hypothetical protein
MILFGPLIQPQSSEKKDPTATKKRRQFIPFTANHCTV